RLSVRANPSASDKTLTRPTSGHELAVFGSVRPADADCVAAPLEPAGAVELVGAVVRDDAEALEDEEAARAGAGAAAAAPPAALAAARVALTSRSVMTFGGSEVMITALSRSPSRSS